MTRLFFALAPVFALAAVLALGPVAARADLVKQSSAYSRTVLMTSSTDHVTGATGLTLTITASKNGAAYGSITPTVTELGSGVYSIALTSSHTGTLGPLDLHVTASGADPSDTHDQVVAFDPTDASLLGLTGVGTAAAQAALSNKIGTPAGASVSADVAALQAVASATQTAVNGLPTASANATAVWGAGTRALTDKANFTLASGEYANIANGLLDLSNGVETGESVRNVLRLFRAVLAGNASVSGATVTFRRKDGTTSALSISNDSLGNRSNSTDGSL